jgi:hypothetical protein
MDTFSVIWVRIYAYIPWLWANLWYCCLFIAHKNVLCLSAWCHCSFIADVSGTIAPYRDTNTTDTTRDKDNSTTDIKRDKDTNVIDATRDKGSNTTNTKRDKDTNVIDTTRDKGSNTTNTKRDKDTNVIDTTRDKDCTALPSAHLSIDHCCVYFRNEIPQIEF